jgi:hypothetical protein
VAVEADVEAQRDQFVGQLFDAVVGGIGVLCIYVGDYLLTP